MSFRLGLLLAVTMSTVLLLACGVTFPAVYEGNVLSGGPGDDRLYGRQGNDTLRGGRAATASNGGGWNSKGDSGGPVFDGSTALRIVSGKTDKGSSGDGVYMAINYALSAPIGVSHVQQAN